MSNEAIAIVVAAAILGGSHLIANRYALAPVDGNSGPVWRVDQWSGEMIFCAASSSQGLVCAEPLPGIRKSK